MKGGHDNLPDLAYSSQGQYRQGGCISKALIMFLRQCAGKGEFNRVRRIDRGRGSSATLLELYVTESTSGVGELCGTWEFIDLV